MRSPHSPEASANRQLTTNNKEQTIAVGEEPLTNHQDQRSHLIRVKRPKTYPRFTNNSDKLLRRHPDHHHPRHFRIKSANTVAANDKVSWVENLFLDKIQHGAIDLRTLRLH
jgi:hypothetical protein